MNTKDPVEGRICRAVGSVSGEIKKGVGDKIWTQSIFKALSVLGEELDYSICSSSSDGEYNGGWLYDLIWYKSNADGQLITIPLMLESEWHRSFERIKYDFEKLLAGRAKYKVMIFQASGDKKREYLDKLELGIKTFQGGSGNETYLLACFDETKWAFEIKSIQT